MDTDASALWAREKVQVDGLLRLAGYTEGLLGAVPDVLAMWVAMSALVPGAPPGAKLALGLLHAVQDALAREGLHPGCTDVEWAALEAVLWDAAQRRAGGAEGDGDGDDDGVRDYCTQYHRLLHRTQELAAHLGGLSDPAAVDHVLVPAACGTTVILSRDHAARVKEAFMGGDDVTAAKLCGVYASKDAGRAAQLGTVTLAPFGVRPESVRARAAALGQAAGARPGALYRAALALGAMGPAVFTTGGAGSRAPPGLVRPQHRSLAWVYARAVDDAMDTGASVADAVAAAAATAVAGLRAPTPAPTPR